MWTEECESECCACNVGTNEASSTATRVKHFSINGDIEIAETSEFIENGSSSEESKGHSKKQSACLTTNYDNVGTPIEPRCIVKCTPNDSA